MIDWQGDPMDYKERVAVVDKQKERLSFRIDKNLVKVVKDNLEMIGLDQGNFLTGFITNIANTEKMPFQPLTEKEKKKAELSAELTQLTGDFEDTPELKNQDEFEKWMEEDNE